jgi:hypothetical protein
LFSFKMSLGFRGNNQYSTREVTPILPLHSVQAIPKAVV